jgi:hypothetical protein
VREKNQSSLKSIFFKLIKNLPPYLKTLKPKKNQKTKKKHVSNRGVKEFVPQNQNLCHKIKHQ